MRKSYTIMLALIVLLSTAMSVQALESKTIERQNGASADADWCEINDDVTTDTYLSVTETKDGTDIYVSMWSSDETGSYEKYGYMFTEDDIFSIDKKLNSASLSEVEIPVEEWYLDYNTGEYIFVGMDTLTVGADWTGKGDIFRDSYTSRSRSGNYVWKSSSSSKYRDASTTGSINGLDLGASYYAALSSFKSASMSMEK